LNPEENEIDKKLFTNIVDYDWLDSRRNNMTRKFSKDTLQNEFESSDSSSSEELEVESFENAGGFNTDMDAFLHNFKTGSFYGGQFGFDRSEASPMSSRGNSNTIMSWNDGE